MKTELDHWAGSQADTLRTVLSAAVPLRLAELRSLPYTRAREWAEIAADALSSLGGEAILRRTPGTAGEPGTAAAFNHLAKGVAALANRPGGVEALGMLWCARHSPSGTPGTGTCPGCLRDRPDPDTTDTAGGDQ